MFKTNEITIQQQWEMAVEQLNLCVKRSYFRNYLTQIYSLKDKGLARFAMVE